MKRLKTESMGQSMWIYLYLICGIMPCLSQVVSMYFLVWETVPPTPKEEIISSFWGDIRHTATDNSELSGSLQLNVVVHYTLAPRRPEHENCSSSKSEKNRRRSWQCAIPSGNSLTPTRKQVAPSGPPVVSLSGKDNLRFFQSASRCVHSASCLQQTQLSNSNETACMEWCNRSVIRHVVMSTRCIFVNSVPLATTKSFDSRWNKFSVPLMV